MSYTIYHTSSITCPISYMHMTIVLLYHSPVRRTYFILPMKNNIRYFRTSTAQAIPGSWAFDAGSFRNYSLLLLRLSSALEDLRYLRTEGFKSITLAECCRENWEDWYQNCWKRGEIWDSSSIWGFFGGRLCFRHSYCYPHA